MRYTVILTIECATQAQADAVVAERLGHEEDYGFDYTIEWFPAMAKRSPQKGVPTYVKSIRSRGRPRLENLGK